jgi:hypothetical protein
MSRKEEEKVQVLNVRIQGADDYQYRLDKYSWDDIGQVLEIYGAPERSDGRKVAAFHGTFHYWLEYRKRKELDDTATSGLKLFEVSGD